MYFVFTLVSWDIDLGNIDLLDTHLDLLVTGIPSKHFVCLQEDLKTSSRPVFKTSSRLLCKTSSRRPEDLLKDKNCYAEDVLKMSWRATNVCWELDKNLLKFYSVVY